MPKTFLKTDEDEIKPKGAKPAGTVGQTWRNKEYENVGTTDIDYPHLHPIFVYI